MCHFISKTIRMTKSSNVKAVNAYRVVDQFERKCVKISLKVFLLKAIVVKQGFKSSCITMVLGTIDSFLS